MDLNANFCTLQFLSSLSRRIFVNYSNLSFGEEKINSPPAPGPALTALRSTSLLKIKTEHFLCIFGRILSFNDERSSFHCFFFPVFIFCLRSWIHYNYYGKCKSHQRSCFISGFNVRQRNPAVFWLIQLMRALTNHVWHDEPSRESTFQKAFNYAH